MVSFKMAAAFVILVGTFVEPYQIREKRSCSSDKAKLETIRDESRELMSAINVYIIRSTGLGKRSIEQLQDAYINALEEEPVDASEMSRRETCNHDALLSKILSNVRFARRQVHSLQIRG